MATDITVTTLSTVGGVGQIALSALAVSPAGMTCLPYLRPEAIEFWGSATNDRSTATKIGESSTGFLVHGGLSANVTRYYWARAIDPDGNEGAFYPVSATAGVSGTTLTTQPGPNSVGTPELKDDAVTAAKMSVGTLSAITANLGTVTAGSITGVTITGSTVRTASGTTRAEMEVSDNALNIYVSGTKRGRFGVTGSGGVIDVNSNSFAATLLGSISSGTIGFAATMLSNTANGVGVHAASTGSGSNAHGLRGRGGGSGTGGMGLVGVSGSSGGYAFYTETGGYGTFTGVHDALLALGEDVMPGEIVCSSGRVIAKSRVDDALLEVEVSTQEKQRGAYGVVSRALEFDPFSIIAALPPITNDDVPTPIRQWIADHFMRLAVNGCGEGLILVCGRGGDIAVGDYICTSSMRGKGQRQNDADGDPDDLLRRHTVAQATQAFEFDDPDQVKLIACIYKCG